MEIEIIKRGLYGVKGEVPVGTRFTVGQIPVGLKGFCRVVSEGKVAITNPARGAHPLDHDGDGKLGGSKAAVDDGRLATLRAEYTDLFGKKPFPGWSVDELQKRIDAKLAE